MNKKNSNTNINNIKKENMLIQSFINCVANISF